MMIMLMWNGILAKIIILLCDYNRLQVSCGGERKVYAFLNMMSGFLRGDRGSGR